MNNVQISPSTQTQANNNVKTKLSILWLIVMLNMIYADILAFISAYITPGAIEQLMGGYSGSVKLSQELLLISAILIEIPVLMIFCAKYMNYPINRWSNILAAVITICFVIGGIETDPYFLFFAGIEILAMLWILSLAICWREAPNETLTIRQSMASE